MSVPASLGKRLASKLVGHAAAVLPSPLSSWGTAMRHEIEHIGSDRDALKWAIGCVSVSYVRWVAALDIVQTTIIRGIVAIFIASWAVQKAFAARFFYLKTAEWFGFEITGHDYRTFLSGLDVFPPWSIALDGAAGLFYIAAAYCLMRKKASSPGVLAMGTVLNGIACASQIVTVLRIYRSAINPESLHHTYFTYAWHTGLIFLLWHGFARDRGDFGGS